MDKEFCVGDKVFDLRFGNGEVIDNNYTFHSPIFCKFYKCKVSYTLNGKYYIDDIFPLLFHGHDLIITVKKLEYEWQVLYKANDEVYQLTNKLYKNLEDFYKEIDSLQVYVELMELFEPSKRLRQESK